ncbi:MAG: hypothetical protein VX642_14655 [Bdellovibrionota bacterium]|nr:hypothetical protein [Bdellovibrionota bacterium]
MKAIVLVLFYLFLSIWQTNSFASSTPIPICKYSAADFQSLVAKYSNIEFQQRNPKPEANLAMAQYMRPALQEIFRILEYKTNGKSFLAELKTLDTIEGKSERKVSEHGYKNTRKIHDYLRGSVVFDSMNELIGAFKFLASFNTIDIGEVSDYFSRPKKSGYRALNFSIRFKENGYIAEIQFHLRDLLEVKHKYTDEVYSEIRKIELEIKNQQSRLQSLVSEKNEALDSYSTLKNNMLTRAVLGSEKRKLLLQEKNSFQNRLNEIELEIKDTEKLIQDLSKELKINQDLHDAIYRKALIPYMDELREIFGEDYI